MFYKPVNANASVITATTTGTQISVLATVAAGAPLDYDSGMNKVLIRNEDGTNGVRVLPGVASTTAKGFLIPAGTSLEIEGTIENLYIASTASTVSCSILVGKKETF